MTIQAQELDFKQLNQKIREANGPLCIKGVYGQRFICSGQKDKNVTIEGTPGNALGAYLDGGSITVMGNAQDAVGDTMNDGTIVIHGHAGDALGLAMRGGSIFVKKNAGYRTGVHLKEYKDKKPVIVVGGSAGSFLGEYLAGGLIIVLGIDSATAPIGHFCGTGMHGGRIFIRSCKKLNHLPKQVNASIATAEDLATIAQPIHDFCAYFGYDAQSLLSDTFYVLKPCEKNPYHQLYTAN